MSPDVNLSSEHKPRRLNNDELSNPNLVFTEFFNFIELSQCRVRLRDWLHAGLADTGISDHISPADLFYFYEQIEKLIEAAYIIEHQKQAQKEI